MDQMAVSQEQTNAQLWEQVTMSMSQIGADTQHGDGGCQGNLAIEVQKMTAEDNKEAYLKRL